MKKLLALIMCLCTATATMSACSSPNEFSDKEILSDNAERNEDIELTYNYNDGAISAPLSYNAYSSEIADFELKLFKSYYENNTGKSFNYAPITTVANLGLLANGAADRAQTNIVKGLGDELTLEAVNQGSSYFISRIEAFNSDGKTETSGETKPKAYVKLQNTLLFDDSVEVRKNFLQSNADYYSSDIFRFKFADETALTKVNSGFAEYTNGNMLSSLDENNKLLCLGAVNIYDTWLNSYTQSDVSQNTFHSSDGDCDVNYMTSNESYIHTDNAQGIIKYTKGTPLKFIAIMPNEDISLDSYISSLTYSEYSALLESLDVKTSVSASIPEFSIKEGETAISLKDELSQCGLADLFTEEIKLSNITFSNELFVNDILQLNPAVTVNATGISGTETIGTKAPAGNKEITPAETNLEFNRPFIFMFADNESNIPVYIGVVDL